MPLRVVVVDHHALMRKAMASLLEQEEDLEVVGEAGDNEGACAAVDRTMPDLLLLALDGACASETYLHLLQYLHRRHPSVRVVVITEHREQDCILLNPRIVDGTPRIPESCCLHQAFRAGARGAVRKSCTPEELVRVLRAVANGDYAFERRVQTEMLHTLLDRRQAPPRPFLTSRERQVVQLLTQGRSNKQIGCILGIREQTVKNHVSRLLEKMNLEDRVQVAVYALRHHLVDTGPL